MDELLEELNELAVAHRHFERPAVLDAPLTSRCSVFTDETSPYLPKRFSMIKDGPSEYSTNRNPLE